MFNFYRHYTITYHNGKEVKTKMCGEMLTDATPEDFTEELTWDNLNELYSCCGLCYPFNIWKFKRGRRVSFFNSIGEKYEKDIKEWKEPLNISVKHEYVLFNPTINYVLNYYNGEKAIRYLVERGLTVLGK